MSETQEYDEAFAQYKEQLEIDKDADGPLSEWEEKVLHGLVKRTGGTEEDIKLQRWLQERYDKFGSESKPKEHAA